MLTEEARGKAALFSLDTGSQQSFRPFLKQGLEKVGGNKHEQLEVRLPYSEME